MKKGKWDFETLTELFTRIKDYDQKSKIQTLGPIDETRHEMIKEEQYEK